MAAGPEPPKQERCAKRRKLGSQLGSARLGFRRCPRFDTSECGRSFQPFDQQLWRAVFYWCRCRNRCLAAHCRNSIGQSAVSFVKREPPECVAKQCIKVQRIVRPVFFVRKRVRWLEQRCRG